MELITPPDGNKAESVGASTAAILKQSFAVMRRRKGLLVAGLCVVYALGAVYYSSRDFVYEARAAVLVHALGDALSGHNDDRQNFMPTHIRLVTSTAVVDRAIEKMKLKDQEKEQTHDWPGPDQLVDGLKVTSQKDTEILEIAFRTKDKTAAVPIVDAVVSAYLDFVNETHRSTSRDILQILTQQKDELDKQLREKEEALLALQEKEGVLSSSDEKNNIAMTRVVAANESLTQARVHRMELEARLNSLKLAIARKEPVDGYLLRYLDRLGSDLIAQSLGLHQDSESYLFQQDSVRRAIVADQLELERMRSTYGPKHPKVLMMEEKIRLTSQSLTSEKITPERKQENEKQLQNLALKLLEGDIKEAKGLEEDLLKQFEAEKAVAVAYNVQRAPLIALEMDLKRLRSFYDTVNLRIRQVNLGGDAGAISTQVIEPPQEPGAPVSPNLKKVALTCTLLGIFFGMILCYLFEWWDTGYRGPEDIVHHLNLAVIGHVPRMTPGKNGKALELVMDHTPRSAEAEAFRTMRTAMMLCDQPPSKFTITSPEPGDGKTLILSNLAISFAKSGMRVLMIDGDLRRPRLRELFERRKHQERQSELAIRLAGAENERRNGDRQTQADLHAPICPGSTRFGRSAWHMGYLQESLGAQFRMDQRLVTTSERLLISADWEKRKKLKRPGKRAKRQKKRQARQLRKARLRFGESGPAKRSFVKEKLCHFATPPGTCGGELHWFHSIQCPL